MRILIVTPGITYFPASMGNSDNYLTAKADGVTDQSAHLVAALVKLGIDVHIAMPYFHRIVHDDKVSLIDEDLRIYKKEGMLNERIHLLDDNHFIHPSDNDANDYIDNINISFAFQREVLGKIISKVNPDLIHCNDWITGLIPAATRNKRIPCLLTLHNIDTHAATLSQIEGNGMSVKDFWRRLFFKKIPYTFQDAKINNSVDLLASAIFGAHFIHTGSPTFLEEIVAGRHNFIPGNVVAEIANKKYADCAVGIPIPVSPEYSPQLVEYKYDTSNSATGKLANKKRLQSYCGLEQSDSAPLFFWPSRLDAHQKGCHLLVDILYEMVNKFWKDKLQIVIIANGVYKRHFEDIVKKHSLSQRVAVKLYAEDLSKLAYAGSDFLLLPSLFEPCGLPAMTGLIYGSLPVAHDTGGLHDTIKRLRVDLNEGNGFLFQSHNAQGLRWAIEQAMIFFRLSEEKKTRQISRIMKESQEVYSIEGIAVKYVNLYKKMLDRSMINTSNG